MRRLYFFVFLTFIIFTTVAKLNAAGPNLIGKWVIKSFDYKYANEPDKDYPLSRDDFESMVKLGKTFQFAESGMLTFSYLKADEPELHAYLFDGKTLKFSAEAISSSLIIAGLEPSSWLEKAAIFEVRKLEDRILLIQKNETWILRFYLERIRL